MAKQNTSNVRPIARIFVQEAISCGAAAGIDVEVLLGDLSITREELENIGPPDFARLWLRISEEMDDEFFGLGARPMRPGSTTLLGHAVRHAPTLDAALRRMLRFLRVVLDEPYGRLRVEEDVCTIELIETQSARTAFAYRTFFLIVHGFTCWLARERIPLREVGFPCAEPKTSNDYGDFFGVPVAFDRARASMSFDARYLSRSVNRRPEELKEFLRTTPESFLRGYRDTSEIKRRIVESCLNGPVAEWPRAGEVAEKLGLSRTTLYRRLDARGQSLAGLKDEVRRTRAATLLTQTDWAVARIAAEVGYAEERAFFRAFRRWYSQTPGEFRNAKTK